MTEFVPLTFPYWIALVTRFIGQGLDVVVEHMELGWVRHALQPLNVREGHLETHALRAARAMYLLLEHEREANRMEGIAHITVAGYFALNGYLLSIPPDQIERYRRLLKAIRAHTTSTEEVAEFLAAYLRRLPEYVRPNVPPLRGSVLMTVPLGLHEEESVGGYTVGEWHGAIASALGTAGLVHGLELDLVCPALLAHREPAQVLDAWAEVFSQVDGQIVLGVGCDAADLGYEHALLGLGRPSMCLQADGAASSTSQLCWCLMTGAEMRRVENPEHAAHLATQWVGQKAGHFATNVYRRQTAGLAFHRARVEMCKRWLDASTDPHAVAESAHIGGALIGSILSTPVLYARTPSEALNDLASALGTAFDTTLARRTVGALEHTEEKALLEYASQCELSGRRALRLRHAGSRLSSIERRKLRLSTPEGWETLDRGGRRRG